MSSATLQFQVAGALIVAWVWMLGRPLLTSLLRRSRRDSVGHFRYQQAMLGQPIDEQPRPLLGLGGWTNPIIAWRDQSLERRRLQLMLAFAIATFVSAFLAIALRGGFVRLFFLMGLSFGAYLLFAAYVGSVQLRQLEEQQAARYTSARRPAAADRATVVGERGTVLEDGDPVPSAEINAAVDAAGLLDDGDLLAERAYDASFFDPIPELQFEPLNLDDGPPDQGPQEWEAAPAAPTPAVAETDAGWQGEPIAEEPEVVEATAVEPTDPATDEPTEAETKPEPTFTAPPRPKPAPRRPKARPIYIESLLDEDDEQVRAVND